MLKYEFNDVKLKTLLEYWECKNLNQYKKKINDFTTYYYYYYYKLDKEAYFILHDIYNNDFIKVKEYENKTLINYLNDIDFIDITSDRSRLVNNYDVAMLTDAFKSFLDEFLKSSHTINNIHFIKAKPTKNKNKKKNTHNLLNDIYKSYFYNEKLNYDNFNSILKDSNVKLCLDNNFIPYLYYYNKKDKINNSGLNNIYGNSAEFLQTIDGLILRLIKNDKFYKTKKSKKINYDLIEPALLIFNNKSLLKKYLTSNYYKKYYYLIKFYDDNLISFIEELDEIINSKINILNINYLYRMINYHIFFKDSNRKFDLESGLAKLKFLNIVNIHNDYIYINIILMKNVLNISKKIKFSLFKNKEKYFLNSDNSIFIPATEDNQIYFYLLMLFSKYKKDQYGILFDLFSSSSDLLKLNNIGIKISKKILNNILLNYNENVETHIVSMFKNSNIINSEKLYIIKTDSEFKMQELIYLLKNYKINFRKSNKNYSIYLKNFKTFKKVKDIIKSKYLLI